jgi:hypothetical protein
MNRPIALVVVAAAGLAHACDRVVDLTTRDAMIVGDAFPDDTGVADGGFVPDAGTGGVPDALEADGGSVPDAGVGVIPDALEADGGSVPDGGVIPDAARGSAAAAGGAVAGGRSGQDRAR